MNRDPKLQTSGSGWLSELESLLNGRIKYDPVSLQIYSTAACIYEITPLAVVIPESIEDICNTVKICTRHKIPFLPRGAGSSLSGNSVGNAVILDMTRHFNNIEIIDENRVRCGVGVVLNDLQKKLDHVKKKFAPDPSSGNVCVIGGMLGNNSGGPHTVKHNNMYKHVEEINLVLPDGSLFSAKNIPLSEINNLNDYHRNYYEKVRFILEKYSSDISANRPYTTKNASGYQVWDILTDTHLNLASLLVGSEGTLGIFTDAVLKIIPKVNYRGIISLYFDDIENVGLAVQDLRNLGASAIEFVDETFIQLALSYKPELKKFLPSHVKFLLYVEFEGQEERDIADLMNQCVRIISEEKGLAEIGSYSTDEEEIEKIFRIRKAATIILNKIQGEQKPVPIIEDASIHPDVFSDFLLELHSLLNRYSFPYVVFGHAGDGNLHVRPLLNFKNYDEFEEAKDLVKKFTDLVIKYNGSLTGEHGDGRIRTPFLPIRFPALMPLFTEIKNIFDPGHLLNPDIIIPQKKSEWVENLRYTPDYKHTISSSSLDKEIWRLEIEKCHGCGTCREYCPTFLATGNEEATARSKANILRGIISGKLDHTVFHDTQFYEIMDYCLNCGQCLTDCPTEVNIPGLAVLAKEKIHEELPYKINEYLLQRAKPVSKMASFFSGISNKTLSMKSVRKVLQITAGIDHRRNFPKFSKHSKMHFNGGQQSKKIVLWSGCSANYNDPEGELLNSIQLFEKLDFEVILPPWRCCSIAKLSYGNIGDAQKDVKYNLEILKPYADQNIPIVFTSASCGYAFMHEYSSFFEFKEEIDHVKSVCYDIFDFLGNILKENKLYKFFLPLDNRVAYHAPCHLKAQKNRIAPADLLKNIPQLQLLKINDSCCGIAGTFGMKVENFDLSMKIGSPLFEEIKRAEPDQVLSGCGTCQIQINQGTGLRVIHPIILINQLFQPYRMNVAEVIN